MKHGSVMRGKRSFYHFVRRSPCFAPRHIFATQGGRSPSLAASEPSDFTETSTHLFLLLLFGSALGPCGLRCFREQSRKP